ncbi:diaminopimelate decarboxylase [Thermodesulfitimonas autotrophica]|uniref:Diaminopimelate decarboxylase n=1 Tax=Thermodesulfitimonas autotrophica TaxID=1894989 RepID=A0A3N5BJU0_9THEO|nr:diaminopimelate decarboxylase [Thermodesulfitimonas autotrophica]RPF49948.1 diaminopimelate decarboxylase [Thermodesulfitimonas autotrophica]
MHLRGTQRINAAGELEIGGISAVALAQKFGTPLYVVDEALFRENCRRYREAFGPDNRVVYAGKALLCTAICRLVEEEGLYLDVSSGGELYTALAAGFPPGRIYFHGNNKAPDEIRQGLEAGVGRFVVDNLYELTLLDRLAGDAGRRQEILLRLTPGIEAHTHQYIRTGQIDSKFGLPIATGQALAGIRQALESPNLKLVGLHCHIGSQIFDLEPFREAARVMLGFAGEVREATGWVIEELDLGGGLGIYYVSGDDPPAIEAYAAAILETVREAVRERGLPLPRVVVEPGRSIAGPAGITLYTVGGVKEIPGVRLYVMVDGGMNDNIRPALYQARYEAALANRMREEPATPVTVAGKCCESGDILIHNVHLPYPVPGDILAVPATGAYNYAMSMNYNRLPRPAMVLVGDGRAEVIVARESFADLTRNDRIPERLWK